MQRAREALEAATIERAFKAQAVANSIPQVGSLGALWGDEMK